MFKDTKIQGVRKVVCDSCGGKSPHPYAKLGDKIFCSRACYEKGIKEKTDHCKRVLDDGYPDNSQDEFDNEHGC